MVFSPFFELLKMFFVEMIFVVSHLEKEMFLRINLIQFRTGDTQANCFKSILFLKFQWEFNQNIFLTTPFLQKLMSFLVVIVSTIDSLLVTGFAFMASNERYSAILVTSASLGERPKKSAIFRIFAGKSWNPSKLLV